MQFFSLQIAKARQSAHSAKRYKQPLHRVGGKVWINKTLWMDAYSRSQESEKLSLKLFCPSFTKKLVGKNGGKLELPSHFKIKPVVHVSHTVPFHEQPSDIAKPISPRPDPVPTVQGGAYVVEKILKHRKRGRGYQWLTLMKGTPTHEAKWQQARDFTDKD